MKKLCFILICVSLTLLFALSGCENRTFKYEYADLKSDVKIVQLAEIERDGYGGEISVEPIKQLDSNSMDAFFKDLSNLEYESKFMMHPENVTGTVIIISYNEKTDYDYVGLQGTEPKPVVLPLHHRTILMCLLSEAVS